MMLVLRIAKVLSFWIIHLPPFQLHNLSVNKHVGLHYMGAINIVGRIEEVPLGIYMTAVEVCKPTNK
jgi:hypothetical protein